MILKRIFKIIIYICFIIFSIWITFFLNYQKINVCLCSPAKKENLYIKEFVEHYKTYKVDKIFLYDNNDLDGEYFEDVINNYILSGFVEIINFRGKKRALIEMMNDCYKKNYLKYDWLIFYEIDEYIFLKNYNNIKIFLSESKFNGCETIQLNWLFHTDNNNVYYENKPIKNRFPYGERSVKFTAIKSILKGKISNITINCVHRLNEHLKTCDGFGNRTHLTGAGTKNLDYD